MVLFDFRANGYSSGKYVTLGWYEALDLNQVCLFLKKQARAKSVAIYGRSMGASATVLFLSYKYRKIMNQIFEKSNYEKIEWIHQDFVDVIVLDSCFNYLKKSIHNMVESKTNKVPRWIIDLVI